ncbi:glycosyltransferase family 1 protein [Rhizobium sp. Root1220]|uniref:glycosyltransferase family 4 protein n=1 Tax=Rhizobium sp. Root1220 TaxID=1736432 RepID=UPI0006FCD1AC|nr:glycosyltransferase family 1 protein [Rhizobium sp. Root1220]KQV83973.1 glycosyl transferase family 1 [Rhizobium sp. Root1220]
MRIGVDARNLTTSMTGIGRYVLEMSRHLAQLGHELYFYLPQRPYGDPAELPAAKVRVAHASSSMRRMIWAQGELPRLAAEDDLDVFWGPAHRLPLFLDPRIARVITIHDMVWRNMASTMRWQTWMADRLLMKPGVLIADEIVADSTATARALTNEFPAIGKKLSVVHPGLTTIKGITTTDGLTRLGIADRYILFVGTLEPRKNLLRLLKAYASLPESTRRQYLLVLAGGQGWRLRDLTGYIRDLRIEPFVRLTGYVSDTDLSFLYTHARFLAMPSLYEGFGFPIIEANAMGIPVLTSNSSSMPEVAGKAGILIDPNSVQSIRNGLEDLTSNEDLYARLVEQARPNASRFDWKKSAQALEVIFEKAMHKRLQLRSE